VADHRRILLFAPAYGSAVYFALILAHRKLPFERSAPASSLLVRATSSIAGL
jgi:hypothetical protein